MRRATVTVLFTDLVASTALTASLDRDEADRVRQRHFAVLRQPLAIHEGTEVKNLGDGLMVVFDRSSAALACAEAMQQAVETARRDDPVPLDIRIGISVGEATLEDDDYFGDPVVEAARLCAAADGGQILVADVVRALAGRRTPSPVRAGRRPPAQGPARADPHPGADLAAGVRSRRGHPPAQAPRDPFPGWASSVGTRWSRWPSSPGSP